MNHFTNHFKNIVKGFAKKAAAVLLVASIAAIVSEPIQTKAAAGVHVYYKTHAERIGWTSEVSDGALSGTVGQSLRLECLTVRITGMGGGVEYTSHVEKQGWQEAWQGWRKDNEPVGTTNAGLRMEAVRIRLYGEVANYYDIEYRAHCQNIGWTPWVKNGEICGTTGQSLRMEGIEIRLVSKDPFLEAKRLYPDGSYWNGNYKNKAWQCHGWACTVADIVTKTDPYTWSRTSSLDGLKAGDLVVFNRPHTIIIQSVSGDTVTYADCNWVGKNQVKWNQTISKSQLTSKFGSLKAVWICPFNIR